MVGMLVLLWHGIPRARKLWAYPVLTVYLMEMLVLLWHGIPRAKGCERIRSWLSI